MSVFNSLKPIKITKLQVPLVPGIQETPYPTKSPTTYGKDYLGKFNQYLLGSLSAKEIIHIKNVLLTKKPSLKKINLSQIQKQASENSIKKSIYKTNYSIEPVESVYSIKKDKVNKLDDLEDDSHGELESFVKKYNDGEDLRKFSLAPKTLTDRVEAIKKKVILPIKDNKNPIDNIKPINCYVEFKKIKEDIDCQASTRQTQRGLENHAQNVKLIQNFQFIADEYVDKIKNNDLFSSDTTKRFFEQNEPKIRSRMNQFSLIKYKTSNCDRKNSLQNTQPISKQTFKDISDDYMTRFTNMENMIKPITEQTKYRNKRVSLKIYQSISHRSMKGGLRNFEYLVDQSDHQKLQKEEQNLPPKIPSHILSPKQSHVPFMMTIQVPIYSTESKKINNFNFSKSNVNSMHQMGKSTQNISTRSPRKVTNLLRSNKEQIATATKIDSIDNSMISETEGIKFPHLFKANLDQLYTQSQFFQQKILQKEEKLNKLMKYFVRIEDIKQRVLKTNLKKLNNFTQNNLFR